MAAAPPEEGSLALAEPLEEDDSAADLGDEAGEGAEERRGVRRPPPSPHSPQDLRPRRPQTLFAMGPAGVEEQGSGPLDSVDDEVMRIRADT